MLLLHQAAQRSTLDVEEMSILISFYCCGMLGRQLKMAGSLYYVGKQKLAKEFVVLSLRLVNSVTMLKDIKFSKRNFLLNCICSYSRKYLLLRKCMYNALLEMSMKINIFRYSILPLLGIIDFVRRGIPDF